jgi:predicted O-linked N-acetylglucosamine transferase (SPINDLY family)
MQQAAELHRQGRLAEAENLYRQVLAADPRHAMAMGLLGVVAHQTGHRAQAEELLTRAVRLAPEQVTLWNNLGVVQMERNRLRPAAESFEQALRLDPRSVPALTNIGGVYAKLGRTDDAMRCFQHAIAASPNDPTALTGLGSALHHAGQRDEAIQYHRRVLTADPNHALAHNNLGEALAETDPEKAAEHFRRAGELQPSLPDPWINLAQIFTRQGEPTPAVELVRGALTANARSADLHHALSRALMSAGRVRESIEHRRRAVELNPDDEVVHSGLLWALNYDAEISAREFFDEHVRWSARHADHLAAAFTRRDDDERRVNAAAKCLRVGYVSGDFRAHAAAHFIEPVLAHHDASEFEVFCYSSSRKSDGVTERIRAHARGGWRDITNLSDDRAAQMIRDDQIDVLIDLAGHTRGNRLLLFARRPAPVQATWIGYSATTGMRAIDYWITDALLDPPGQSEPFATETIVRLPRTFTCYQPPPDSPPVVDSPAGRNGYVTFGSFNRVAKLNDGVLDVWSRVMLAVPRSRLLIMCPSLRDEAIFNDLRARLSARGVDRGRLDVRPSSDMPEYLAMHGEVDIALDPFPFTGHTSTLHGLWMGVPVVTLAGKTHVARRGVSVMTNLDLADWVAASADDYVRIAERMAGDVDGLARLRRGLRERMLASSIMRYGEFARDLESAYREMWHKWCER